MTTKLLTDGHRIEPNTEPRSVMGWKPRSDVSSFLIVDSRSAAGRFNCNNKPSTATTISKQDGASRCIPLANMLDLQFSITTFGSQRAEKKALLLHGLMGTGAVFFKVANELVKDGYVSGPMRRTILRYQRVDCPDLLGHGWAPHIPPYSIQALVKHLADNLSEDYDVIGGVSFGSTIAAVLYSFLGSKPARMVLAEPLLDHPSFSEEKIQSAVDGTKNIPSEDEIMKANPTWIRAEATLRRLSLTQIDPLAIRQLFEVSQHGCFLKRRRP